MSDDRQKVAPPMQSVAERAQAAAGGQDSRAGELLARNLARPRELVRKLVIGDVIGERPRAGGRR